MLTSKNTKKLEKLVEKPIGIFSLRGRKVKAIPIGEPVTLHGPIVEHVIHSQIDKYRPGTPSVSERKPQDANAYVELYSWNEEWDADSSIPCRKIQFYRIK